jgi:hypothetical protein
MQYEINPCKACWKKYEKGDCNINTLNNCLTETAAAFSTFPSVNTLSSEARNNWEKCIVDKMAQVGRTPCDFQLNKAPVFVQVPHFFPGALIETNDKDKALAKSLKYCESNFYPAECKSNCYTDYDAVIEIIPSKKEELNHVDSYSVSDPSPSLNDIAKQNSASPSSPSPISWPWPKYISGLARGATWIFVGIVALFVIILAILIKFLVSKKLAKHG